MKSYTKNQILKSIKFWQKKLNEQENSDFELKVETIVDGNKIKELLPAIINIVIKTYEPIGGYYGQTNINRLARTTSMVKIIKNDIGQIISCAFYRNVQNSYKLQAYGQDGSIAGKNGVKKIIETDISPYDNWIWGEVSGKVEKYFKIFKGYPLPNEFAAEVLEKNPDNIELSMDGFHYKRKIGENTTTTEKVIYGFPNQEIANRALSTTDYEVNRHEFNAQALAETDDKFLPGSFKGACSFVDQLSDLYDEQGWDQLTPGLSAMLDKSINILKQNTDKGTWVSQYIDNAEYLRENMPEITFVKNKFFK